MKNQKGFTLIELMTSVSIFLIIMTISMGSILNVFDANRKSRALKTVMTNLNLAVDSMSREMRFGSKYHCGTSGSYSDPRDCWPTGESYLSFLSNENVRINYRLSVNGAIEKISATDEGWLPITAREVVIDSMVFYAIGTSKSDTLQPKVIIKIQGHSGSDTGRSDFTLQTLVSQRMIDRDIP